MRAGVKSCHICTSGNTERLSYPYIIAETLLARPDEYNDLLQELISIGYEPDYKEEGAIQGFTKILAMVK